VTASDLSCPRCGEVLAALSAGTRLYQRYQVIRALRRGGGISYQTLDETRGQPVLLLEFFPPGARRLGALVILPDESREALERWTAQLSRTGPASGGQQVQLSFEQNGTRYAVTALPLGQSLLDRVRTGRLLAPEEAQSVMAALARTLAARHAQRDGVDGGLGPSRVSLTPEGARLDLGWGQADWPAGRAPEQFRTPARTTASSDVYALGATLLYGLTGEALPDAAQRALGQPLPALPPGTPPALRQAITLSLAQQENERLDAAALVRLLQSGQTVPVAAPSPNKRPAPQVAQAHQGWLTHLFSDGEHIVTAGTDLRVRLFDHSGQALRSLDGLEGRPVGLGLSAGGVVAADESGRVRLWEGRHSRAGPARQRLLSFAVRTGNRAVALQDDGTLGGWDMAGPDAQGSAPLRGVSASVLHVTPEDRILLGTQRGQVMVFDEDLLLAQPWWQSQDGLPVTALVSSGDRVAVAVNRSVTVLSAQAELPLPPLPGVVTALALSPNGAQVAAAVGGSIHLIGVESGAGEVMYQGKVPVRALGWSGDQVVAGNDAGQLVLLQVTGSP
jgi:hypothetical protein